MADRFWVGGTASWDGTAGTKWATTSGGTGGASVPTTADDVFLDASSTGTVSIAAGNTGAKSITCTGFTGTLTFGAAITIAGSLTLVSGMSTSGQARITFTGSGTLTSAGKNIGVFTLTAPGGTFGLGDACTCINGNSQNIFITAGTFNTNDFNLTYTNAASNSFMNISGSTTRTVNLGASTLTFAVGNGTCWDASNTTNLTFNAGTSTLSFTGTPSGGGQTFNGGGLTYYNVSFSSGGATTLSRNINSTNTFNDLTISNTATGLTVTTFNSNQTINGTLNCSGGSPVQRNFLRSNTLNTVRTLTAATLTATDCDFRDITISGGAAGSSPTRAGDCKGNSGINFPSAKTVYWNLVAGGNWSATAWASSSGGSPDVNNFPLAQDSAIIEATGLNSGTTLTINAAWNIGSIDLSARTANTVTLASGTTTPNYYGDYKLGTGVTITGTGAVIFLGRVTQNITGAGRTITFPISVELSGTSFKLLDAFTSSSTFTFNSGTVDLSGFTLTATSFSSNNSNTRTIALGGGTFILTGSGSIWTTATNTNLTITGSGTVSATSSSAKTFAGGGGNYSGITLNNGGSGALTITGGNTFGGLSNTVQPTTFSFTAGTTTTITNWNINGTAGNLVTIQSVTAASHTLSKASGTVSADYLSISRSTITGSAVWYAGANSTDGGNNSTTPNGWLFSAGPTPGYIDGQATIEGAGAVVVVGLRVQAGQSAIEGIASLTAAAQFVLSGQAAIDGVASSAVLGQLIHGGQATIEGVAALSAAPQMVYQGAVIIEAAADVVAASAVVYLASAAIEGAGAFTASGGLLQTASALLVASGAVQISASIKWTQVPDGTEIWNQAADSATTWTPVAAGSETWTRVQ